MNLFDFGIWLETAVMPTAAVDTVEAGKTVITPDIVVNAAKKTTKASLKQTKEEIVQLPAMVGGTLFKALWPILLFMVLAIVALFSLKRIF
jgi:hypothetical protein